MRLKRIVEFDNFESHALTRAHVIPRPSKRSVSFWSQRMTVNVTADKKLGCRRGTGEGWGCGAGGRGRGNDVPPASLVLWFIIIL